MENSEKILVCDLVQYGLDCFGKKPQRWRVSHHLRRVEDTLNEKDVNEDSVDGIITKILLEDREEQRKARIKNGLPANRRYKLVYCKPEEATHVSLTGISGAQAPISECKKVGTVNWSDEFIAQNRANAVSDFWLKTKFNHDWIWE